MSPVTLPDELIAEVLSLLKPKSVMRFKCVSKSWNSLISDPFFINMHLIKSSRSPNIILFPDDFPTTSSIALLNPLLDDNPSINHFPKESKYKLMKWYCHVIGSCNGLTCLVNSLPVVNSPRKNEFYLWNPSTRWVSKKPVSFLHSYQKFNFSFGYDSLTNKYKVLAFHPNDVRILALGDNIWRNIQSSPTPLHEYSSFSHANHGVYLNNSLNWFALRDNKRPNDYCRADLSVQQFVIISLDLRTETYTQFQFPQCFDQVPVVAPIVCRLMECLCFSHYSRWYNFDIWQMKEFGVEKSWTKLLKFNYHDLIIQCGSSKLIQLFPLHVFENGDTLILSGNHNQLICYSSRDNRVVRQATITNSICERMFNVKHYVESLHESNILQ
ncbi:F-box/kelch-repeat protein At3g23880-like [Vicia villosa]|uniref:F-box/kelch-repeat protein At3g23880-like n=1 Tax=Vicia villosa TaxID=3911 RepID=UPI00273BADB4|nr:F-box/kelch-repeat protein At3g23880-like [Vicia villosa]